MSLAERLEIPPDVVLNSQNYLKTYFTDLGFQSLLGLGIQPNEHQALIVGISDRIREEARWEKKAFSFLFIPSQKWTLVGEEKGRVTLLVQNEVDLEVPTFSLERVVYSGIPVPSFQEFYTLRNNFPYNCDIEYLFQAQSQQSRGFCEELFK